MPSNGYKCPDSSEQDPIVKILDKYKDHPSIKLIKAKTTLKFLSWVKLTSKKSKKSFQSLDPKKAAQKDDINTIYYRKILTFLQNTHVTISMTQVSKLSKEN